jgi:hypothetical protein
MDAISVHTTLRSWGSRARSRAWRPIRRSQDPEQSPGPRRELACARTGDGCVHWNRCVEGSAGHLRPPKRRDLRRHARRRRPRASCRAPAHACSCAGRARGDGRIRDRGRKRSPRRICPWRLSIRVRSATSPVRPASSPRPIVSTPPRIARRKDGRLSTPYRPLRRGHPPARAARGRRRSPGAGRTGGAPAAGHRDDRGGEKPPSSRGQPRVLKAIDRHVDVLQAELSELDRDIDGAIRKAPPGRPTPTFWPACLE